MKISRLLAVFFIVSVKVFSQDEIPTSATFDFQKGNSTYVFIDLASIRSEPSIEDSIVDYVLLGTEVFFDTKTEYTSSLFGKTAAWYKVHYKKENVQKEGYIWGGDLCINPMRRNNVKFLFGLKGKDISKQKSKDNEDEREVMIAELKAVRNDSLISTVSWELFGTDGLAYSGAKIYPPAGLKNIQYLVNTVFSGEACGIPAIYQYTAWNGKQLILLPQLMFITDAGMYFYNETLYFPTDKLGKPGMIIKKITQEETDEKNKTKKKSRSEFFSWDGKKLKKVK